MTEEWPTDSMKATVMNKVLVACRCQARASVPTTRGAPVLVPIVFHEQPSLSRWKVGGVRSWLGRQGVPAFGRLWWGQPKGCE